MKIRESDVPRKHLQQLVATGISAYRLIESVEMAASNGGWSESLTQSGIVLAEALIAEEVTVGDEAVESVASIATLPPPEAQKSWECLARTVSRARPSRAVMKTVIGNFGGWLEQAGPERRDVLLRHLPNFKELLSSGDLSVMDQVLKDIGSMSVEGAEDYLQFLTYYKGCSEKAYQAILRLAQRTTGCECGQLLKELQTVLPTERMPIAVDSEQYVIALATISDICARECGKAVCSQVIALMLTVGKLSLSSGYYAARSLADVLRKMDQVSVPSYLRAFKHLIETIGVGITGFSLQELPKLYAKHGVERTDHFVALACEIGSWAGPSAAVWFLERRTEIAREVLPN